MAVTVDKLRSFLSLPEDEGEDMVLDACLSAARSWARGAGIPDYQNNWLYDMALCALAARFYDARGTGEPALDAGTRQMLNSFALDLRYAGEDASSEKLH